MWNRNYICLQSDSVLLNILNTFKDIQNAYKLLDKNKTFNKNNFSIN